MNLFDWFDRQSDFNKGLILGGLLILALALLGSYVFYGADFAGLGEWVKELIPMLKES